MRDIIISKSVQDRIAELENYLKNDLKLSKESALRYSGRMRRFVLSLADDTMDYPLCRFKSWCRLGYRCAVFEKHWVFAYEITKGGIVVQDMSHVAVLAEVVG